MSMITKQTFEPPSNVVKIVVTTHIAMICDSLFIAGSLEAAYSLNWGAQEIWGKGGGETLALL